MVSLISDTLTGGLLEHRRLAWTRSRPTAGSKNPTTGAPIPGTPTTGTVDGWFSWLGREEALDFGGDAAAKLITATGQLQVNDTITNASMGSFVALQVRPQGDFDTVALRRSG